MAAGLADRRHTLEEPAMFSSAKGIYKSPRENKIVVRNILVYKSTEVGYIFHSAL
jgi:hypothetical protein